MPFDALLVFLAPGFGAADRDRAGRPRARGTRRGRRTGRSLPRDRRSARHGRARRSRTVARWCGARPRSGSTDRRAPRSRTSGEGENDGGRLPRSVGSCTIASAIFSMMLRLAVGRIRPGMPTRSPPSTSTSASANATTSARSSFGLPHERRREHHRGRTVRPDPHRMRGFPLALAHIKMIVARGAAPVDARGGFARHEAAVLPEVLAGAGAAAAVQAVDHRRGDAARFQNKPRHRGDSVRARTGGAPDRVVLLVAMFGISRHSRQPIRDLSLAITPGMVSPSARAAKVSAMRCFRIGSASSSTSSTGGRIAAFEQRARAHREHQRLRGARTRAPGDGLGDVAAFRCPDAPSAPARGSPRPPISPTGRRRTRRCAAIRSSALIAALAFALFGAGGVEQDLPLGFAVRIVDVDLHQEAVELRFGQRIGAFLLQRVLRREHMERRRQVVPRARDRDVMLLHRLQQRGLRARRGAVDFVGHQQAARRPGRR